MNGWHSHTRFVRYPKDTLVFRKNQPSDYMYIVKFGRHVPWMPHESERVVGGNGYE